MSDFPYVATGIVLGTVAFFVWRLGCWVGHGIAWIIKYLTAALRKRTGP